MTSTSLPYMKNSPKIIFFTDFDGTITLKDSNDYMTDNLGFGAEERAKHNKDVLDGKRTFRYSSPGLIPHEFLPHKLLDQNKTKRQLPY